jgi:hypothetical protein
MEQAEILWMHRALDLGVDGVKAYAFFWINAFYVGPRI